MKIKKKNYNEYAILDDGIWIRNFTLQESPPLDQNNLFSTKDLELCLENETTNYKLKLPQISTEQIMLRNVVILSDGYNFDSKKRILSNLPKDVHILGTNGVLRKWNIRPMTYYIANNPYADSMKFIRNITYFPPCIASTRTYPSFVKEFVKNGIVFTYGPVSNKYYSGLYHGSSYYEIDDYRNPICTAIGLVYRFKSEKVVLLCHDDCFAEKRPAAVKVENNLWTYPQQQISNEIIDANLMWLKLSGAKIAYHSEGLKLTNAEYIGLEEVTRFFTEEK